MSATTAPSRTTGFPATNTQSTFDVSMPPDHGADRIIDREDVGPVGAGTTMSACFPTSKIPFPDRRLGHRRSWRSGSPHGWSATWEGRPSRQLGLEVGGVLERDRRSNLGEEVARCHPLGVDPEPGPNAPVDQPGSTASRTPRQFAAGCRAPSRSWSRRWRRGRRLRGASRGPR